MSKNLLKGAWADIDSAELRLLLADRLGGRVNLAIGPKATRSFIFHWEAFPAGSFSPCMTTESSP
jgi:hypothetical protein